MKHQPLAKTLQGLRDKGWEVMHGRFPGEYLVTAASYRDELPTPEHVPRAWWPHPTYRTLRQIVLLANGDKVSRAWTREGVPWAGAREQQITAAQLAAYADEHAAR